MKVAVIVLAAGMGRRFGSEQGKQFVPFQKAPLFLSCLKTFLSYQLTSEVVVVVPPHKVSKVERLVFGIKPKKKVSVVAGGPYRGESVKNGFIALTKKSRVVLVHDAARPLVTKAVINAVAKAAKKTGVALAAVPLSDTLKMADNKNYVRRTIPREQLWCAQTPQGFSWKRAQECLLKPHPKATDDVSLAEKRGFPIRLVMASSTNIKVTYPLDLKIAESVAKVCG